MREYFEVFLDGELKTLARDAFYQKSLRDRDGFAFTSAGKEKAKQKLIDEYDPLFKKARTKLFNGIRRHYPEFTDRLYDVYYHDTSYFARISLNTNKEEQ